MARGSGRNLQRKKRPIIGMKGFMRWIRNMGMGSLCGRVGISILVIITMMRGKGMGRWSGLMVVFIKDIGLRVCSMGLELCASLMGKKELVSLKIMFM